MKLYQVVQKLSIDPLYLMPAMFLGRFCPEVDNLVAMVHKQSKLTWLPLLPTVNNLVSIITMEHNPNPLLSKAHLTNLNLNNFKMIEAVGLKIIVSRSP
jgi:hypothetical protein